MGKFDWREAEQLAEAHMKQLGFIDAERTASGADGGIDVESEDAVGQVKFVSRPVGSPEIQKLRGAAFSINFALFYSNSGYTKAAELIAEKLNVALFVYTKKWRVKAHNELAEKVVEILSPSANLNYLASINQQINRLSEFSDSLNFLEILNKTVIENTNLGTYQDSVATQYSSAESKFNEIVQLSEQLVENYEEIFKSAEAIVQKSISLNAVDQSKQKKSKQLLLEDLMDLKEEIEDLERQRDIVKLLCKSLLVS